MSNIYAGIRLKKRLNYNLNYNLIIRFLYYIELTLFMKKDLEKVKQIHDTLRNSSYPLTARQLAQQLGTNLYDIHGKLMFGLGAGLFKRASRDGWVAMPVDEKVKEHMKEVIKNSG